MRSVNGRTQSVATQLFVLVAILLSLLKDAATLDNGAGLTPPLGWNTWTTCGEPTCGHDVCNEAEVKSVALAMQSNGMQELGWNYVNLDDCWALQRDPHNHTLQWDPERFPSGLPALIGWLHERDFKFGLYTSAGNQTCSSGQRPIKVPGSRGHYELDAATFASWGVDYIKLDWCGDIKDQVWEGHKAHAEFAQAVLKTNRSMFLEVVAGYWFFLGDIGTVANSWRFCEDHHDEWSSTTEAIECRISQVKNATGKPGAWAFMDMLATGGKGCVSASHCPGQSDDAYRSEFAIWSVTQSPLIVATDVRNMTAVMKETLLNKDLIAIHQNTSTPPGKLIGQWLCDEPGHCLIYGRRLDAAGQDWLVGLVNTGKKGHKIGVLWTDLGWHPSQSAEVRDMWRGVVVSNTREANYQVDVPMHGTAIVRITAKL